MSRKQQIVSTGAGLQYGSHDMSFCHLTSFDFGRIQPLCIQECVPNDQIKLNLAECNITTAPNPAPLQNNCSMRLAAFYVPNRVIWQGFNEYITGISDLTIPYFNPDEVRSNIPVFNHQKADYFAFHGSMGIDPNQSYQRKDGSSMVSLKASLLPYRAYNRIWWDYFRNSNVIPDSLESSYIVKNNSRESFATYYKNPKYACWQKDFLTNNLSSPSYDNNTSSPQPTFPYQGAIISNSDQGISPVDIYNNSGEPIFTNNVNNALGAASSFSDGNGTVNSLRTAISLQKIIEKWNTIGGRLKDRLRLGFGSSVQSESLQMSEYLGQSQFDINFETQASSLASNEPTISASTNPFGSNDILSSIPGQRSGVSTMTKNGLSNINYHCKEHGFFIIVGWILPNVLVSQGISPMWFRGVEGPAPSRFDFLTPEFVNNGFEPLYMHEVTLPYAGLTDFGTFDPFNALGYRGKYESYKYNRDVVSGCFIDPRTRVSMYNWWMPRDLRREAGCTDGDGSWITGKTGTDLQNGVTHNTISYITSSTRQAYDDKFTVTSNGLDHFICQCKVNLEMVRPLPSVALPKIETLPAAPHEIGGTRL